MEEHQCAVCEKAAAARLTWPTSLGPQSGNFCAEHIQSWQEQFKHTQAASGLIVGPPTGQKGE